MPPRHPVQQKKQRWQSEKRKLSSHDVALHTQFIMEVAHMAKDLQRDARRERKLALTMHAPPPKRSVMAPPRTPNTKTMAAFMASG